MSIVAVARRDKTSKAKERLFQVPQWFANLARDKAGLDLSGHDIAVDAYAVRHVIKSHGSQKIEESREQIAITYEDIEVFPAAITDPDKIIFGLKGRRKQDQVAFIKRLPDGSTLVITEDRTRQREVALDSMRKYPPRVNDAAIVSSLTPNVRSDDGVKPIIITRKEIVNARKGDRKLP